VSAGQSLRATGYEETRTALNLRFLAWFVIAPAAALAVSCVLSALVNGVFVGLVGGIIVFVLVCGGMVRRCWPVGIRIDESGLTIGAVRSSRAIKRTPTVYAQAWGVYSCPWEAVRSVTVVTDPATLRELAKSPEYYTLTNRWGGKFDMTHCNIGVLSSPFMHAALVAEIDPDQVTGTDVQSGYGYEGYKRGQHGRSVPPQMSPTWIVPTRHPEALEEAIKRFRH
jgi:hypothetical protein